MRRSKAPSVLNAKNDEHKRDIEPTEKMVRTPFVPPLKRKEMDTKSEQREKSPPNISTNNNVKYFNVLYKKEGKKHPFQEGKKTKLWTPNSRKIGSWRSKDIVYWR
jgi:hypothetical protein